MTTNKSPESNEEWTIHSLNIHGTFFHRKITSLINNHQSIHLKNSEYPVEYPTDSIKSSTIIRSLQIENVILDYIKRHKKIKCFT